MTPEDRADALTSTLVLLIEGGGPLFPEQREKLSRSISGGIALAIRQALDDEREACAQVVEENRFCDDAITTSAREIRART